MKLVPVVQELLLCGRRYARVFFLGPAVDIVVAFVVCEETKMFDVLALPHWQLQRLSSNQRHETKIGSKYKLGVISVTIRAVT